MHVELPGDAGRIKVIAEEFNVPYTRLQDWVRRGHLKGYRMPGYLRSPLYVSRGDVRQLLGIAESSPAQSGR